MNEQNVNDMSRNCVKKPTNTNILESHKHCTRWWTHRWSVPTGI